MNTKSILIIILTVLLILSCCCNVFFLVTRLGFNASLVNSKNLYKLYNSNVSGSQVDSQTIEMLKYTLENYYLKTNELTDKYSCALRVIDYSIDESAAMKGLEKYYYIASCYGYKKDNPKVNGSSFSNTLFYAEYIGTNVFDVKKNPQEIKEFSFPNTYLNSTDKNIANDKDKEMIRLSLKITSNELYEQAKQNALNSVVNK